MRVSRSWIVRPYWLFLAVACSPKPVVSVPEEPAPAFPGVDFVGHLVPDTDAIAAAIGAARLFGGRPVRSGSLNRETRFLLERFGLEAPPLIKDWSDRQVFLVDHNQTTQAPPDLESHQIVGILDHHALREGTVVVDIPIYVDIRPWGSTCTIVAHELRSAGRTIPPALAGILLGGVLSDTLDLNSPTTTDMDREIVPQLARIADVEDPHALFALMLEAKSNLSGLSDREVLLADFKIYVLGGRRVGIGVAETAEPKVLQARLEGLRGAIPSVLQEHQLELFFFVITDVLGRRAHLYGAGPEEEDIAARAFDVERSGDGALILNGILSRKRQIVPALRTSLGRN